MAIDRRLFLQSTCAAVGALGAAHRGTAQQVQNIVAGQAEHVISIWLGGGMGGLDTFDPKSKGDPKSKKAGSYYDAIETSVPGVQVCEHLPKLARWMHQVTAVRTVHHDVIDEHAAATNRMHTGRPISGTVIYPSIGSVIANQRGSAQTGVPAYVVIGYPNITRGPGFLGAKDGYLYLTDTSQGPAGLSNPQGLSPKRQERRQEWLKRLGRASGKASSTEVSDYRKAIDESFQWSSPDFVKAFDLKLEPQGLRDSYGGEFGQRCLLARRLTERGVRFIEVSHNLNFLNGSGWDVHNEGILQQHALIQEMDTAVSALIADLNSKSLLDRTLIVITTEFGRPAEFDSGGGRGHQASAFCCVLAGGGLRHSGAYGQTDDLGKKIVSQPVSVPDFFETIHASLGIDYSKSLYDADRPVPITDMGKPTRALFA